MRFTEHQYDEAIKCLRDGKKQLVADGHCCAVCSDSGHMAYECGFNPLDAMGLCQEIARSCATIHDDLHAHIERHGDGWIPAELLDRIHVMLHWLAGYDQAFGVQLGPRRVVLPPASAAGDPDVVALPPGAA